MKTYNVTLEYRSRFVVKVEAKNEEDALKKAEEQGVDDITFHAQVHDSDIEEVQS